MVFYVIGFLQIIMIVLVEMSHRVVFSCVMLLVMKFANQQSDRMEIMGRNRYRGRWKDLVHQTSCSLINGKHKEFLVFNLMILGRNI
jgi:hypothetical protein